MVPGSQCLINAVTGEVGTGSNMSGKATNQELTTKTVPHFVAATGNG
jgi:hypothetical protein